MSAAISKHILVVIIAASVTVGTATVFIVADHPELFSFIGSDREDNERKADHDRSTERPAEDGDSQESANIGADQSDGQAGQNKSENAGNSVNDGK